MAVSHTTKVFAVTDCKAYPILDDPEGGTTTYGEPIDVPGIKSVAITGSVETKRLRGDNRQLDADSVITEVNVSIEYAKLSLDFLSLLMGGAVVDSGTGATERAEWSLTDTSRPLPFRLAAVSATADPIGGNVDFDLWNLALSSFPDLGLAEEDYRTHTAAATASPRKSDGKWVTPGINRTARDLSAVG